MIADLPVGDNLQDHIMTFIDFHDNSSSVTNLAKVSSPVTILQYLAMKSGKYKTYIDRGKHLNYIVYVADFISSLIEVHGQMSFF